MTTSYICALLFQSIFEAIRERMGVEVWMKKKKKGKGKTKDWIGEMQKTQARRHMGQRVIKGFRCVLNDALIP